MQLCKHVAHPLDHQGLLGAFSVLYTDIFFVLSVIETIFEIAWEKKAWVQGLKEGFICFRIWCLSYHFFQNSELLQMNFSVNSMMFILKRDLFSCRMLWQMLLYQHSIGFRWLDTAPGFKESCLSWMSALHCWFCKGYHIGNYRNQESGGTLQCTVFVEIIDLGHSSSFWHLPSYLFD